MQRSPTCENCQRNYELKDSLPIGNKIPILLPCGHTFCEGCLIKAAKMKSELQCFTCEEKFQLHPSGHQGVKHFVPNIYLLGLLLYNKRIALESSSSNLPLSLNGPVSSFSGMGQMMKEKSFFPGKFHDDVKAEADKASEVRADILLCEECSLRPASCHCEMCQNVRFCEGCFRSVHAASKLLSKHLPLPLAYSSEVRLTCERHEGRALEFYDKDAKEAVCAMCIITERCKGHSIIPLSEMQDDDHEVNLKESYTNVQETLKWLQNSSKTLVNALPEEIFECNNLYSEIHNKFTACHTLLLKRQIELNIEAAEKLSSAGTINDMLQEITSKINEVSTTIKNFDMVKSNKNIVRLKADEFIEKFRSITETPCIVERLEEEQNCSISYVIPDQTVDALESIGSIDVKKGNKFILKRQSDFSEEKLKELNSKMMSEEKVAQVVKSNEILDEEGNVSLQKKSKLSSLLLGGGTYDLVYVTDPGNPNDFKVQRYADKERLEVLMSSLNKYCRQSTASDALVYKAEEGQLVCAQFTADNMWYRARVINTSSPNYPGKLPTWQNGFPIHILYIDYGNTEWLPLSRLRQLKTEFLEIPEMAIPCSLMDIVPPHREVTWSDSSIKAFHSLTADRPLLMNIRKRMAGKLYVDLRKPDDDEPTAIDDDRPASVRDALVFLDVAVFISPASQPNLDAHRSLRSYLPPIELEKGTFYDVTVTHAENPHHLYIQKLDSIIQNEQKHLTKLYSGRNKKTWKVGWPYKNLVVGAKFSVDQTWYRGIIKNVNRDETVDVEYIDYGNKETLSFDDIKKLPEMFLKVPIQCQKVKLYGVDKFDGSDEWSDMANLLLKEKFIDRLFVVIVKGYDESNIPMVELIDTMSNDDINMNLFLINHGAVKDLNRLDKPNNITDMAADSEKETSSGDVAVKEASFAKYMGAECPDVKNVSVTGVFVDDDAHIYLHVNNDEDTSLTDIMQHLNGEATFHEPLSSTQDLVIGQACVGKYVLDNLWYRVEVVKIIDEKDVLIYFIDFGNHETVECTSLVAQAIFIDIPSQCLKTRLFGVVEDSSCANYGWSEEAREYLNDKVVNEDISFTLKSKVGSYYHGNITLKNGSDLVTHLSEKNLVTLMGPEFLPLPHDTTVEDDDDDDDADSCDGNEILYRNDYIPSTKGFFQKSDEPIDVTVTQIDRPDLLYIQCANNDYLEMLNDISEEINEDGYFDDARRLTDHTEGMACIAKYTDDEMYYRGRIEKLDKEVGTADILFVDYGNSETVPIPSIKPIGAHLLELPVMSVHARLDGIVPLPLTQPKESYSREDFVAGSEWLVEHMKKFYTMVADKKMSAVIKDSSSVPILIDLYDASELSENGGGELVPVKSLMIQEGICS